MTPWVDREARDFFGLWIEKLSMWSKEVAVPVACASSPSTVPEAYPDVELQQSAIGGARLPIAIDGVFAPWVTVGALVERRFDYSRKRLRVSPATGGYHNEFGVIAEARPNKSLEGESKNAIVVLTRLGGAIWEAPSCIARQGAWSENGEGVAVVIGDSDYGLLGLQAASKWLLDVVWPFDETGLNRLLSIRQMLGGFILEASTSAPHHGEDGVIRKGLTLIRGILILNSRSIGRSQLAFAMSTGFAIAHSESVNAIGPAPAVASAIQACFDGRLIVEKWNGASGVANARQ